LKALALFGVCALLLLAGCAVPGFGGDLAAKDAAARAEGTAKAWRSDAMLVGLGTLEYARGAFDGRNASDSDFPFPPQPDASPGDGRAPQWYLQYHAHSSMNMTLAVAVYANGTVQSREQNTSSTNGTALDAAAWQVDSPQAAQVAMQDTNFSAAARASDGVVGMFLSASGGGPYGGNASGAGKDPLWVLFAGSASAGTGASVLVNARTGEKFTIPNFGFPPFGSGFGGGNASAAPVAVAFQGQVNAPAPTMSQAFRAAASHRSIQASFTWQPTLPTDTGTLTVKGPQGTVGSITIMGSGTQSGQWVALGAGEYTATVALGSGPPPGVQASFTVSITVT
jgi:hypothetical protein